MDGIRGPEQVRFLDGIAPQRPIVLWDHAGAEQHSATMAEARGRLAWDLSVYTADIMSALLAQLTGVTFPASMIRTARSEFSRTPQPPVPVQIEVLLVFTPDPVGALNPNHLRMAASIMVLNWFARLGTTQLDASGVRAVRVTVMGFCPETVYELDVSTRTIIDGYGGNFQDDHRGMSIPTQF